MRVWRECATCDGSGWTYSRDETNDPDNDGDICVICNGDGGVYTEEEDGQ